MEWGKLISFGAGVEHVGARTQPTLVCEYLAT